MKGKIPILVTLLIIIAAIIGFRVLKSQDKAGKRHKPHPKVKFVKVKEVKYENYQAKIIAYGRLNSRNRIEIFSEVSGILQKSNPEFKEGNFMKQGQILVKIDERDARLNLYSLRSDMLNIFVNLLPDIKSDFPESFNIWKDYLNEFDIEKPTSALPEVSNEKERFFLASRNVFKIFYGIRKAELLLSKYTILAPFDGIITSNLVETGALIRTGQKIGEFRGTYNYELELSINQNDAKFISLGDKTLVSSDDFNGEWKGEITRLNPNIDPNSQTIKLFVQIHGQDLKDGMYMKAVILGNYMEQVFEIPRKAIVDKEFVYCVEDSFLFRKQVEIIRVNEKFAYIKGIDSVKFAVTETLINVSPELKVKPVVSQTK